MANLRVSGYKLQVSPSNTTSPYSHTSIHPSTSATLTFPHERHLPKTGPVQEGWRTDRAPSTGHFCKPLPWAGLWAKAGDGVKSTRGSSERWGKLRQRRWQPCSGSPAPWAPKRPPCRAALGAGEEGVPRGGASISRTEALNGRELHRHPRLLRTPPASPRAGSALCDPSFCGWPRPHSPWGHLPSSGAARGRSPRSSTRSRDGAMAEPRRRAGGVPRAAPPRLWRAGGSGENSGLQMIRKYPVTWGVLK